MHGLTVRWSPAGAPEGTDRAVAEGAALTSAARL
jgi:hypothetical protein